MVDQVVRTTHNSFGGRTVNSLKQLAFVPILLIAAIWLLVSLKQLAFVPILLIAAIWLLVLNEGNSITQQNALKEGMAVVVDLHEDVDTINVDLDGKLIHFSGTAKTDSPIFDTFFGVGKESGQFLMIMRNVQMYQWVEREHKEEENSDTITTYTYTKEWVPFVISSSSFKGDSKGHENPEGGMLYQNQVVVANDIHVGDFLLSTDIVQKMNWWQSLPFSLTVDSILDDSARTNATSSGGAFYFGAGTQSDPQIGDTRVIFKGVRSQVISIVARQTGKSLSTYTSKSGGSVLLVEAGYHDEAEMFQHAEAALSLQTWHFRFLGWLLLFIACQIIMELPKTCANVIPYVGNLIEAGSYFLSLVFATGSATIIITIAWFAYRPCIQCFSWSCWVLLSG